jgi:hypothetical protein
VAFWGSRSTSQEGKRIIELIDIGGKNLFICQTVLEKKDLDLLKLI